MAKRDKQQEAEMFETTNTENTENTAAVVEETKTDERYKMVTHPETGELVKRKDFILECWVQKRMSRGEIAKKLTEITGKKVPYQIVFAATKNVAGGPVKTDAASAEGTNEGAAE